jgi:hypothetical protein
LIVAILIFGGHDFFAGFVGLLKVDLNKNGGSVDVFAGEINLDLL